MAFVLSLVFTSFICIDYKRKRRSIRAYQAVVDYIFILYALLIFFATTIARKPKLEYRFRPIPFHELSRAIGGSAYMTRQIIYNILMMVPFGILLPAVFEYKRDGRMIMLFAFGYSVLIELTQFFFRFGAFETDDLLNNCIGAFVGYGMSMLIYKISKAGKMTQCNG